MANPPTKLPFSGDIVVKAELRCHAYCKNVGQMTVWFHFQQCLVYGLLKLSQCGSYMEDFGENIKFPTIPDEATNAGTSRLISSPPFFKSIIILPTMSFIFFDCHCKFFDLWTLSGSASPGLRNLYDRIYCKWICGWTFFCKDLTCIVYFKHNAYVRMTIHSSLSSFLHNELLRNEFETPDVNFNTQDVRLDLQLPLLRYYISWVWGNVNANF